MKKILSVILLMIMLISCQDIKHTPKPENLIPEEKMVEVLTEISLLHGARSYNKNMMEEKGIDPYPYLMNKFGIDSVQLVRSNNYYAENYKQYKRIYDKVKSRLEILMAEYDSIREIEERKQDSIRKLMDSVSVNGEEIDSLIPDTVIRNLPDPVFRISEKKFTRDGDTIL